MPSLRPPPKSGFRSTQQLEKWHLEAPDYFYVAICLLDRPGRPQQARGIPQQVVTAGQLGTQALPLTVLGMLEMWPEDTGKRMPLPVATQGDVVPGFLSISGALKPVLLCLPSRHRSLGGGLGGEPPGVQVGSSGQLQASLHRRESSAPRESTGFLLVTRPRGPCRRLTENCQSKIQLLCRNYDHQSSEKGTRIPREEDGRKERGNVQSFLFAHNLFITQEREQEIGGLWVDAGCCGGAHSETPRL